MKVSLFFSFFFLVSCTWLFGSVMAYARISKTITVDLHGRGQFTSVQKAVHSVPEYNNKWIRIRVHKGIYREKVNIPCTKPYILLEGQGAANTVIQWADHASSDTDPMLWNDTAATLNKKMVDTATFSVFASNFVARKISFKNTHNLGPRRKPIRQAVAALIGGDQSAFYDCSFIGYQDTLFDRTGRHYFQHCLIEGAIDFIFGYGQSVYERCYLKPTGPGYITAHGRGSPGSPAGFVFLHCNVLGSNIQTFLGRAWAPYSRVLFYRTTMSDVINPQGWEAWNARGQEYETTFVEHSCSGPGSNTAGRVPWEKKLTMEQLGHFISPERFMNSDQWLRQQPRPAN